MVAAARTRLYLVRHCDVHNPNGVLYGHLPHFVLSTKGERQAHDLGEFFAGTSVRRIYTSPLERARQTSRIIRSHLHGVDIIETDELTEARFGRYLQGVRPRDVPWRRPLWFIHMLWPGVLSNDESVRVMADRVSRPLHRLIDEFPGEGGICVSHGDPIQAFWIHAEHRQAYALHRLQVAKGGVLQLDYAGHTLSAIRQLQPHGAGATDSTSPQPGASHA